MSAEGRNRPQAGVDVERTTSTVLFAPIRPGDAGPKLLDPVGPRRDRSNVPVTKPNSKFQRVKIASLTGRFAVLARQRRRRIPGRRGRSHLRAKGLGGRAAGPRHRQSPQARVHQISGRDVPDNRVVEVRSGRLQPHRWPNQVRVRSGLVHTKGVKIELFRLAFNKHDCTSGNARQRDARGQRTHVHLSRRRVTT